MTQDGTFVRFPAHPLPPPPREKSDGGNARAVDRTIDKIPPRSRGVPALSQSVAVNNGAARPATAKGKRDSDATPIPCSPTSSAWSSGVSLPGLLKFVNMKSRRLPAASGGAKNRAVVVRDSLRAPLMKDGWTIFRGRSSAKTTKKSLSFSRSCFSSSSSWFAPPDAAGLPLSPCQRSLPRRVCLLSRTRVADQTRTRSCTRTRTRRKHAELFQFLASAIVCQFACTIYEIEIRGDDA